MATRSQLSEPAFPLHRHDKQASSSSSSSTSKRRTIVTPRGPIRSQRLLYESTTPPEYSFLRHDDDVDELQDHVIMAIDRTYGGKIGCAYYIARHELLCCMQDIECGGQEVLEILKLDIEPTLLLMSQQTEGKSIAGSSERKSSLLNDDMDYPPLPYEVIVRPASDFKYESALAKLSTLSCMTGTGSIRFLVPGENMEYDEAQRMDEMGLIDQHGKLLTVASNLDLDNKFSIGCAGVIVGFLQRRRASEYLRHDPEAEAAYRISRMEMFTLKDTMSLSKDTLSSLQIIQSETHPNIANQGPNSSGSKESLSVYGLFHGLAKTPQGKARLRQMFLRPCLDMQTIANRHDFISILVRPENQFACEELSKGLHRIKNMQVTIASLRRGVERGSQNVGTIRSGVWAELLEFCYHSIELGDTLREVVDSQNLEIFATAIETLDKIQLQRVGKMVHDTIDLDESLTQHRTVIKRGVEENLDKVKDAYDAMEEVLARVATEITDMMPEHVEQRLNVVFLPQLGFHVTVPLDERTNEPIWIGDELWERRFKTEKYQYFKNVKMKEMDTDWGDLHAIICDTEIEISHDLAQRVLQREAWLIRASNLCGELDSLLALAHGALQYKLTRPRIVEENVIDIKGGRHLLQEMTVASYIPNDTLIAGGDDQNISVQGPSMILLTGPNYSGKSVYKKQVALIVYMAQVGSFVPADAATLGITDKIMTRINTAETVSKIESAFVIDLQQIAWALKSCTNRSLVVIDEFGKGTDNCDGAGLASGVLQYLLNLGPESPKVLASTHFHEICERGEFNQYRNLAFAHMEVRLDHKHNQNASQQLSHVTYLYNLCEGRSTSSYGNQCAAMNGIPRRIVDRAILLTDLVIQGEDLVATCALLPPTELKELEDAETVCRLFLREDFAEESCDVQAMLDGFRTMSKNPRSVMETRDKLG